MNTSARFPFPPESDAPSIILSILKRDKNNYNSIRMLRYRPNKALVSQYLSLVNLTEDAVLGNFSHFTLALGHKIPSRLCPEALLG